MVGQAPDSLLRELVKNFARNEMLSYMATARGFRILPAEWDSIRTHYRDQLMTMERGMGIAAESLAADTASRALGRGAVAARHVEQYFQAITDAPGTRQYYEVPPFLADELRDKYAWRISQAGVDRALERARVLRGPETPSPAGNNPRLSPMQPSPGGPPISPPAGGGTKR